MGHFIDQFLVYCLKTIPYSELGTNGFLFSSYKSNKYATVHSKGNKRPFCSILSVLLNFCTQSKNRGLNSRLQHVAVFLCRNITSSPLLHFSLLPFSPVWIILQLIIFHISIPPSAHTDLSLKLSCVIWSCHSRSGFGVWGSGGLFTEM